MKKNRIMSLLCILCLLFSLTGCGTTKAVKETANTFLTATTTADMETISANCTEEVLSQMGLEILNPAYNETAFYASLDIEKDSLEKAAQASISDFYNKYSKSVIQSYEITDVEVNDGVGTVYATLSTYSRESIATLSGEDFHNEIIALMQTYQQAHMRELISIKVNNGEEAMMIKIFNDLMPDIMTLMKNKLDSFSYSDVNIVLFIEDTGAGFKVTGAGITE